MDMILLFLGIFIAFISFFVFKYCLFKKKPYDPVLKNWPFLGMVPDLLFQIHRIYDWTVDVLELTGMSFNFKGPWLTGSDILVTADPRNVHHIMSTNFGNYPKGPEFKKIFDVLGDGVITADFELWEDLRYSGHALFKDQDFQKIHVNSNVSKIKTGLIPLLDHAAKHNIILDFQDVLQRFTFDTSSILMTGFDPMCLSIELPKVDFGEAVDFGEEAVLYRHILPVILWKLQHRLGLGTEGKLGNVFKMVDKMFSDIISSRREEIRKGIHRTGEDMDMVSYYLNIDTNKYKLLTPESDKFIRDAVFNFLIAGRDTASSAITSFFWLLSNHPRVTNKIKDEINSKMPKFDPKELDKLLYLHCAILETLRLYPPVPFNHKSPAKSDVLPSGHKVKADSKIVISIYAAGRLKSIWGEDATEFKPERWITENETLRHEPSYKFLAFNCGPRTCLGKYLALTQIKIVAVEVLRNYDIVAVEKGKVMKCAPSIILRRKNGFKVKVSKI